MEFMILKSVMSEKKKKRTQGTDDDICISLLLSILSLNVFPSSNESIMYVYM